MIVRKMRLERGWSQEVLADLSGLNVRTVQRLEAGDKASVESLKALGAAFNVNFNDLKESAMDNQDNARELKRLLEKAEADMRSGFQSHVLIFALVNAGLAAINLVTQPKMLWFPLPLIFWGIGLFVHWRRIAKNQTQLPAR